jgi:hypothetical protein
MGAAVFGVGLTIAASHDLHRDSKQTVTFGTAGEGSTQFGDRTATLTARNNTELSPGYQKLDPTPVVKKVHHSVTVGGSELALFGIGVGLTTLAVGTLSLSKQRAQRRIAQEPIIQKQMRTTTLRSRASYPCERNIFAAMIGRIHSIPEINEFELLAAKFGRLPGPDNPTATIDTRGLMDDVTAWINSPLDLPPQPPTSFQYTSSHTPVWGHLAELATSA